MDDAERERAYERVGQWFAGHSEQIVRHTHLMPASSATTLRLDRGAAEVTDGPFVEGKEVISGFAEVDVANLYEAMQLAKSWPACPVVEIRPIASVRSRCVQVGGTGFGLVMVTRHIRRGRSPSVKGCTSVRYQPVARSSTSVRSK